MGEHDNFNINNLGCWKILEEIISPKIILSKIKEYGTYWDIQKLISVLMTDFNYKIRRDSKPQPGDLVISGIHLGIVSEDGKYIISIMKNKKIKSKINNIKVEYALWR